MTEPPQAPPGGALVRFEASGNIGLAGEVWGQPDAPPVLLAHGGGQTRLAWKATGARLAEAGFYAVAIDLRGHGDSDRATDYSLDAFRDDIVAVATRLGRPALVGASLGGSSSLLAVGEIEEKIASALVLVDIAPRLEPEGVGRIMAFMERHLDGFSSMDEAVEAVIAYLPHRAARPDAPGLRRYLRSSADGRLYWHWDPQFLHQAKDRHLGESWTRSTSAARRVTIPTLVVRGGRSDVLGEGGVEELCRLVPQAEVCRIAEAHHMVAGDENDLFAEAVLEFLGRVRASVAADDGVRCAWRACARTARRRGRARRSTDPDGDRGPRCACPWARPPPAPARRDSFRRPSGGERRPGGRRGSCAAG